MLQRSTQRFGLQTILGIANAPVLLQIKLDVHDANAQHNTAT
jgi:hypothetical protein